uniref:CSON005613 protein n=1 Tax=Culicoides sonorensis TaxID=179676 RepID=A0A336K9D8_CULSO
MDKSLISPNRTLLNQSLTRQVINNHKRNCVIFGSINAVLLSIIWFDISQKCPYSFSYWYYCEYAAAGILSLSLIYYILSYMYHRYFVSPLKVTEDQRKLLRLDENDGTFVISPTKSPDPNVTFDKTSAPINVSTLSWQSYNEGTPTGVSSASWTYNNNMTSQSFDSPSFNLMNISADVSFNQSLPSGVLFRNYNHQSEMITDAKEIKKYLKETNEAVAKNANILSSPDQSMGQTNQSFSSFWNNYRLDDLSALLKTSLYQLSPSTSGTSKQNLKEDHSSSGLSKGLDAGNSEVLKKIPSEKLSAYVANLRLWMSDTILNRIVKEFDHINETLKSRGFSDIQIGAVGFERLKKTAENHQLVSLHVPTLPMIIPFLEMSTNQEYLVNRIRDLAHGKCISDYRWNSGNSYRGTSWDDHMPTDAAILFHLFCTYLDGQLMPLPDRSRPFYGQYVIEIDGNKKSQAEILNDVKNKTKCAILCMNPMKPKLNFISDEKIHTCAHDRNNLFYVIIQFLLFMKTRNESLLEGVSLGKRGINIMCCVEDGNILE